MELEDQRARPTPTSWPRSAASTRPRSQAPPPGSAQRLDGKHGPVACQGDGELVGLSRQCGGAIPTQVLANQLVHDFVKAVFGLVFVGIKRMQLLDDLQPPSSKSDVGRAFSIRWKLQVIDQPDRAA